MHVYKAQPIRGDVPVPDLQIIAMDPMSVDAENQFEEDAQKLVDALYRSLPGRTMDALLIEMQKHI